ncbi:TRAP transporter small permease [Marinobacterium sp. YM272]|uniref:TRAP transporter small permease n=1 Tax=Marinobacterium sp. YM272 TaxID=3421654 RepID=UPI003D7FC493
MNGATTGSRADARAPFLRGLKAVVARIDRLSFITIAVAFGLMATLVSVQVFMRYVLSSSIDSAAELSRLFFVWTIFLALPQGISRGVHVGIDALINVMPGWLKHWCWRLTTLLSLVLMLALSWLSIGAIGDKWQELMPTLDVTAAVYYIPVLICSIHASLHLLLMLLEDSRVETPEAP